MKIVHVRGTMCSGKSHVIQKFSNRPDVQYWDVLNFYKEEGCIDTKGIMDWDKWEVANKKLPGELDKVIAATNPNHLLIIESGTNSRITEYLYGKSKEHQLTVIELEPLSIEELTHRANLRNVSVERVLDFREHYIRRHYWPHRAVTQGEAELIIKAKLDGIKIGIIGTAGRDQHANKLSKELYINMYKHIIDQFARLELNHEDITLVSGGAAWSDHLAVSLYLADYVDNLTIHMPCEYHSDSELFMFTNGQAATAATTYHHQFSRKMGGDTFHGLCEAINKGAETTVSNGFLARNLKIAEDSEILFAFTWAQDAPSAKSGTRHTWDHSNAKVKIHVNLSELKKDEEVEDEKEGEN